MKLTFKELTIKNFLSFGNNTQTFKFDTQGIKLIKGQNKDKTTVDDEREQNGVGKTTIMQALYYALYGTSIGNTVTLANLVNNINKKKMEVSLTFDLDTTSYKIERGRNPQYFRLYKQGEEVSTDESCGDSRDTQSVLQQLIGISPELFTQTILLTCKIPIYLNQNLATRRQIIEQTLGFNMITDKVEILKDRIKQKKIEIEKAAFEIETLKKANETTRQALNNQYQYVDGLSKQWVSERETKIKQLRATIGALSNIDFADEKAKWDAQVEFKAKQEANQKIDADIQRNMLSINTQLANIKTLDAIISSLSAVDIEKVKEDFAFNNAIAEQEKQALSIRAENAQVKMEENQFKNTISKFEAEESRLADLIEKLKTSHCPYCGSVMPKAEEHLKQAEADMLKVKTDLVQTKAQLEMCNDRYKKEPKIETRRQTLFKTEAELYAVEGEIKRAQESKSHYEAQIKELEAQNASLEAQKVILVVPQDPVTQSKEWCIMAEAKLGELKKELQKAEADNNNPYTQKLLEIGVELQKIKDVDTTKITEMELYQAHQEMLLKLLNNPTSAVRQAILEKSIAFLNAKVVEYLSKLNSPIYVQFNADMSVDMSRNGLPIGAPSSGEEGRISLALQFAFRDTWECLNGVHPSIMMVDEVIDRSGLDESGVSAAVECLKSLNDRCRYVVSHNARVADQFNDVILIVKHHDFSTIETKGE